MKLPRRTCIACRQCLAKSELIRLTWHDGHLSFNELGSSKGRGAYVDRSASCILKLSNMKMLERAFRVKPGEIKKVEVEILIGELLKIVNSSVGPVEEKPKPARKRKVW